jgi:hypothetical protein
MPVESGVTAADPSSMTRAQTVRLLRWAAVAYVMIAAALTGLTALAVNVAGTDPTLQFDGASVVGGWCRFDCTWYVDIADRGYDANHAFEHFPAHPTSADQSSVAFFPGYPVGAVRPMSSLLGITPLATVVATWLAGLLTVLLFAAWCASRLDPRRATFAVACLVLYPYGFFLFGAGYADALFLAATIGAFVLLERDQALLAGVAGAVATATRPIGLAVAAGLLLRAIDRRGGLPLRSDARSLAARLGVPARVRLRALRRRDLGVLLAPAGWIAWSVWLWSRFGDPFAYSTVQAAWDQSEGPHTWFKIGFFGQVLHGADAGYRAGLVIQAVATVLAICVVPFVVRQFGAGYGIYTLLAVVLGAFATKDFQGMGRYLLAAFPVFAVCGTALAPRAGRVQTAVLVAAAVLLGVGAFGFARDWYLT